jgi:hypothetical protein
VPDRVVPLPTTARLLGEATAAFLGQPDLATSTRRSYQPSRHGPARRRPGSAGRFRSASSGGSFMVGTLAQSAAARSTRRRSSARVAAVGNED